MDNPAAQTRPFLGGEKLLEYWGIDRIYINKKTGYSFVIRKRVELLNISCDPHTNGFSVLTSTAYVSIYFL